MVGGLRIENKDLSRRILSSRRVATLLHHHTQNQNTKFLRVLQGVWRNKPNIYIYIYIELFHEGTYSLPKPEAALEIEGMSQSPETAYAPPTEFYARSRFTLNKSLHTHYSGVRGRYLRVFGRSR